MRLTWVLRAGQEEDYGSGVRDTTRIPHRDRRSVSGFAKYHFAFKKKITNLLADTLLNVFVFKLSFMIFFYI